DILLRDFEKLYCGEAFTDTPLQYRDYAAWLANRELSAQETYWLGQFAEEQPDADLPLDGKRREDLSHEGALTELPLPELKREEVEAFCKKAEVTPYAFFTAAISAFLGRLYDAEDVCLGMPVSCRTHADTEGIVGMLVNTIALRSKPEGKKSFAQYLQEVKEQLLGAMEHQEYPFNTLVENLKAQRGQGRAPLFDVFFNYFDAREMETLKGEGFTATEYPIHVGAGKFDLVFDLILQKDSYSLICNYRPALLKKESVQGFQSLFGNLILSFLRDQNRSLGQTELLTEAQKKQILEDFHSVKPYNTALSFPDMLRQTARMLPSHKALVYKDQSMSYEELDSKTDSIASALLHRGVEKEAVVAVLARPGFETFLGAIGAMKAGCAYMPIDPQYPVGRIEHMIRQSRCKLLLIDDTEVELPAELTVLSIKELTSTEHAELPEIGEKELAYVIFTSGSTGQPKGVMIEHSSLSNLIQWHNAYYKIRHTDRSTKYAGFGFDASVHEMYPQLAAGATIHIIPEELRMDLPGIRRYMEEQQINVGFFPTPVAEQFAKQKISCLEKVITGGDKLKTYSEQYPIYNNYGPTEATVLSTVFPVDRGYENIPIGKPIDNVKVYVVNRDGQLQPIGLTGELWLGGRGLARGYIHDEERTAERFAPDPFCPGQRIYKTGDLGMWLPDGNLLYLGRNDHQVKVRGNRVELGEIEAVSTGVLSISECAVIVDRSRGTDRLVLFYSGEKELDPKDMATELRHRLPLYMVPDLWVYLREMPLTANGKIDKARLRVPDSVESLNSKHHKPSNETELRIHQIWSQTLGVEEIDVVDNFFEVGGTSLSLAIMFAKLNDAFGGVLNIADVFAYPSIRKLSDFIRSKQTPVERIELQGLQLKPECYGKGTAEVGYHLDFRLRNDPVVLLQSAFTFILGKLSQESQIKFYYFEENCCFSTVFCDMIKREFLREIADGLQREDKLWDLFHSVRKPTMKHTVCALHVGSRDLSHVEEQKIMRLFDLLVFARITDSGIDLRVRNLSRTLSDGACRSILKLLAGILEKFKA
ncbi:MAG: amino acid adenylation domain-containing protein, partial [Oscillospiraceae bacterium]|nr:amino acid adenylation domain-containing protein [Oscillospiraceae bacterium]